MMSITLQTRDGIFFLCCIGLLCRCVPHQPAAATANRLVLKQGEIYQLKGNQFFLDTLILLDGATLRLDKKFNTTTLRVSFLSYGDKCTIEGRGLNGEDGADLITENTTMARTNMTTTTTLIGKGIDPRTNTMPDMTPQGKSGQTGTSGVNLRLYCKEIRAASALSIHLGGGDGGMGGLYNASQQSTIIKTGRARGGSGGDGGDVVISYPETLRDRISSFFNVVNQGGYAGNNPTDNFKTDTQKTARIQASSGKIEFIPLRQQ
jgi:hypothetical protein